MPMSIKRMMYILITASILLTTILVFNLITAPKFEADLSMFTSDELEWLEMHPVIEYAPDYAFYPYEYYEQDHYEGLSIDYIHWIESNYPLQFNINHYTDWEDILTALENKDIDLVTSTARSPQREAYILFTGSYISMDNLAFVRSTYDSDFYEYDLIHKKTAVIKGYYTYDVLMTRHPDIELIVVENSQEGFSKLLSGEVDIFFVGSGQALKTISDNNITTVKINENIEVLTSVPLSMGTHFGNPELQSILIKILNSIPQEVHESIYDEWMHIDFAQTITFESFRVLLYILLAFTLGVLFILLWNQLLKKQVTLKTDEIIAELHERRILEDQLKNMINALPSLVYVKNSEGLFTHVNQTFCDHVRIGSPAAIENKSNLNLDVLQSRDLGELSENEDRVLTSHKPIYNPNNKVVFRNGDVKYYDTSLIPFVLIDEENKGVLSIDVDITERIKARQELEDLNDKLELKVKERTLEIETLNNNLTHALERITVNEHELQVTNDELTKLLETLRKTQLDLIETTTMGAQGQNLGQVSHEISIPIKRSMDLTKDLINTLEQVKVFIEDEHRLPDNMLEVSETMKTNLEEILLWLQESSRIVETFKLISLVDHGLQPTKINLKLMLETCMSQLLIETEYTAIICSDSLILKASPNAFHQILSHLIRYTAPNKAEFVIDTHIYKDDLHIEFVRNKTDLDSKIIQHMIHSKDLGLQIIKSIIEHYFNGQLENRIEEDKIVTRLVIPSLFIENKISDTGRDEHE